jgi:hypothetical protein
MNIMLRPANRDATDSVVGWSFAVKSIGNSSHRQNGAIEIGKVNLILIGLILVILFTLISKEEADSNFANHNAHIQTQALTDIAPEAKAEAPVANELPESPASTAAASAPEKVATKQSSKKHNKAEPEVAPALDSGPVVQVQTHQVQGAQAQAVIEPSPKDASTKMLVFNIWSVSELRLRSAYTTFMNDGGIPVAQLEARKKEYLSFVAQRARKCGELDNKFTSNINTAEKLSFNKGDVEILECYASENNTELDKLNLLTSHGS